MNIFERLRDLNCLNPDNLPKKNIKRILNNNLIVKELLFNLTNFVIDPCDSSIRERVYCIFNNITQIPKCPVCSSNNKFRTDGRYAGSYGEVCSKKCVSASKSVKQKKKETCIKHYQVENPFQSKNIKAKIEKTLLDRYGVEHPLQSDEIQQKYKQTCLINHGFDNPMKSKFIHTKAKKTNIENKKVEYNFQYYSSNEVKNIAQQHISQESLLLLNDSDFLRTQHHEKRFTLTKISEELGVTRMTVFNYLKKFNIELKYFNTSMGELEIVNFIKSLFPQTLSIKTNIRNIIPPYELDIYIPEHNIAIEYNGLYWHSEASGKSQHYHLMKTELCEEKGVRLIHIFEDEWRDQQQKCKDTLQHLLGKSQKGTYARNTTIKEISWKQAKDFLDKYHLLNAGTSGNYRIGGFDKEDNLIGVMVFGIPSNEHSDNSIVELKRFITNKKNNPGLGSKMFKYAIRHNKYKQVIAFVDRRWFTGLVKSYIGFELVHRTRPALWWTDGIDRYHRRFLTKQDLIKEGFNKNNTKHKMLLEAGYTRIWDSGKLKLRWNGK